MGVGERFLVAFIKNRIDDDTNMNHDSIAQKLRVLI